MSAPQKPSKPGLVRVFKALYTYEATEPDEVSFKEGDILYIPATEISEDSDWWKGTCHGKTGLIPSNYVASSIGEASNNEMQFPMHEAAKRGQVDFLRDCFQQRIPINGVDKSGSTPLYWAAHGGHDDCVKEILKHGNKVQLDVQNLLGDTALHGAAWKGHETVVRLLISAGAKQDVKNKALKLARDLAREPSVAALFTKRNTDDDNDYLDDEDDEDEEVGDVAE